MSADTDANVSPPEGKPLLAAGLLAGRTNAAGYQVMSLLLEEATRACREVRLQDPTLDQRADALLKAFETVPSCVALAIAVGVIDNVLQAFLEDLCARHGLSLRIVQYESRKEEDR